MAPNINTPYTVLWSHSLDQGELVVAFDGHKNGVSVDYMLFIFHNLSIHGNVYDLSMMEYYMSRALEV